MKELRSKLIIYLCEQEEEKQFDYAGAWVAHQDAMHRIHSEDVEKMSDEEVIQKAKEYVLL